MIATLLDMLTYRRPAGTKSDRRFVTDWIANLPGAYRDAAGNWIVVTDPLSPVLFSCHTDTVHWQGGRQTIKQTRDIVTTDDPHSNCLGGDDTVGCYLMREMILNHIGATFVFHFAEEKGGIGSDLLASDWPKTFGHLTMAIAFDRRGTSDVITHQAGGRCCSDVFAMSLATALNAQDRQFAYAPSSHGIFTDTANYTDHVAECTNISVGYSLEHTRNESINVAHVARLRDALLALDWPALLVRRLPGESDDETDLTTLAGIFSRPQARDWRATSLPNRRYEGFGENVRTFPDARDYSLSHDLVDDDDRVLPERILRLCMDCGEPLIDDTCLICGREF